MSLAATMLLHARRQASSPALLRHAAGQHTRCRFTPVSQRYFASFPTANDREDSSRPLLAKTSGFIAANHYKPPHRSMLLSLRTHPSLLLTPPCFLRVRTYSRRSNGRNLWNFNSAGRGDWLDTVKTGALLALGAGAVVAAASVGFGFIMFGAAGYGVYTLYQKFFAPYRSPRDPFGDVQADIDRIFRSNKSSASASSARADKDVEALVAGLPFVVRGLVKTLFSFVGGAMQSSMARAGELRRTANEYMRANTRIVSEMGNNVSIATPQNWMEYTVNGVGRVEAVFPVMGNGYAQAQVNAKATVGANGELKIQELKYRNQRTGEVIDLIHDARSGTSFGGRRKTVVDAEYVDLDGRH